MKSSAVLLWFYNQQWHNPDKQDSMPMLCQVIMTTLNPVRIRINWITFVKFAERERHEPGGLGINIREYRGAAPVSVYSTALILWARQPRPGSDCSHSGLWEAQIWSNMKYKYQPFRIQFQQPRKGRSREEISFHPFTHKQVYFERIKMHCKVSLIQLSPCTNRKWLCSGWVTVINCWLLLYSGSLVAWLRRRVGEGKQKCTSLDTTNLERWENLCGVLQISTNSTSMMSSSALCNNAMPWSLGI